MQEHLDIGLVRKTFLEREILGGLDIRYREPHRHGL